MIKSHLLINNNTSLNGRIATTSQRVSRTALANTLAEGNPCFFAEQLPSTLQTVLNCASADEKRFPSQLLILKKVDNKYRLYSFEQDVYRKWKRRFAVISSSVGKNGISCDKKEGDNKTPSGCFRLTHAFGIAEKPHCRFNYIQITDNSFWVDDPTSKYYNQWIEGQKQKDWRSAERLADYPVQYTYALAIGYNTDPIIPGKGSAIFLHCGESPTAGCIAIPRKHMLTLLEWLEPEMNPHILIIED